MKKTLITNKPLPTYEEHERINHAYKNVETYEQWVEVGQGELI